MEKNRLEKRAEGDNFALQYFYQVVDMSAKLQRAWLGDIQG